MQTEYLLRMQTVGVATGKMRFAEMHISKMVAGQPSASCLGRKWP